MPKGKWCWVATQTRKGWRLALAVGPKNYNLPGLLLADERDVKLVTSKGNIVFVHMRNQLLSKKGK